MPHASGGGSHSGGSHSGGSSHSSHSHSGSFGSHSGGSSSYSHSSYSSGSSYSSRSSYSSGSFSGSRSSYGAPPSRSSAGGRRTHAAPPPPLYPEAHTSKKKFSGAERYVYYSHNQPHYLYSNYQSVKKAERKSKRWKLWIYIPLLLFFINAISDLVTPKEPLSTVYNTRILISDGISCLGSTEDLLKELTSFQKLTGITPAIVTDDNAAWQTRYTSLENYAYDVYVNRFTDEKHWLIVYTEPVPSDPSFVDWYWESMLGDDTGEILTTDIIETFRIELQRCLTASSRYTVSEAITSAFAKINPLLMKAKHSTPVEWFTDVMIILGFIVFALFRTGFLHLPDKKPADLPADAVPATETAKEISCAFCDGVFLNDRLNCPHCGAPRTKAKDA